MSESTKLKQQRVDSSSDSDSGRKNKKETKPKLNINDDDFIEPPFDNRCIFLDGLSDLCSDEMVKLYLLLLVNETLDEKLKIENFRRNNSRVLVKFNNEINFDQVLTKQQKLPELCGELIKLYRVKVTNSIKITNLPLNCSEEILRLYFTNTKMSNGGDIDRLRLFNFDSKALISFKNYEIVAQVLSRSHIISGNTVKLVEFYGPIEDESFVDDEADDDALFLSKSIVSNKKDARRLKKGNKDDQQKLSSSYISSGAPLADRTKIILSNLQENINIQQLDFFIQLLTSKAEVQQVSWSFEFKGKLLIEFKKEIDLKKILQEYHKSSFNNLNGKQVQIEPVNMTRTLIIVIKELNNIKEQSLRLVEQQLNSGEDGNEISKIPATRDLLELYFVNKQRSGGGEIEFIERRSARYWLIKMKDQRVFKEILSRKHVVDFKEIKVFPYYENFGLPYVVHFNYYNSNSDSQITTHLPYKLKIKDDRLRYFVKVKNLHQKLNDILSESNAVSKYNRNESNTLYVHFNSKLATSVPYLEKIWRIRVKESIEYFLQIYKYEKLTLSYNQWSTILKTKQINEALLYKQNDSVDIDEDFDGGRIIDNEGELNRNKFFGNLAVISVKDTTTNIEINAVGPTLEVDRFIVKVKDIICKAYFTYELEERIINFKTYLLDCEQLLGKWLQDKEFNSDDDSDVELLLTSSRANLNDTSSLSASYSTTKKRNQDFSTGKLDKTKRKTIDEFISKLERDHLDMELSYGKLFQELGYTFLSSARNVIANEDDDEDGEYRDFNDYSVMDESYLGTVQNEVESEMDKIKHTLDELKVRIIEMRAKFRQYLVAVKKGRRVLNTPAKPIRSNINTENEIDEDDDDEDENEKDLIKLCVFVKEQMKIITLNIHKKCKIKELKLMLSKKIDESEVTSIDRQKLTFNGVELINDSYSISDYGISNKCTITCEVD
jgi:hypothetical protein